MPFVLAACGPSSGAADVTATASTSSSSTGDAAPAQWDGFELAYLADRAEVEEVPRWTLRLADPEADQTIAISQAAVISDRVGWSPDGEALAYISPSDGEDPYAARVVDVEGDIEVGRFGARYLPRPTPTTTAVVWSLSAQELTATAPAPVAGPQCPQRPGHTTWRVPVGPMGSGSVLVPDAAPSPASWSKATGALVYSTRFPVCDDFGVEHPDAWSVWQRPPSHGAERIEIPGRGPDEPDVWHPLWSPDGRRLAANVGRIDDAASTRVVVVQLDGAELPEVDSPACKLVVAEWFPGGDELLTRGTCPDDSVQHAIVDVRTGIVTKSFADLGPTVSIAPDGRRIAYARERDGETWVAILDRETDTSTWIAPGEHPQWRPPTH